jgi:hypothetical protein
MEKGEACWMCAVRVKGSFARRSRPLTRPVAMPAVEEG